MQSEQETVLDQSDSREQEGSGDTDVEDWRQEPETVLRGSGSTNLPVNSTEGANETRGRVAIARRAAEMTSSLGSRLSAGIDHTDLHSRLVPGTDHEPGAALTRRTKMFVEIRERHRLQIATEALEGVPARRNHSEEELAAIRQRIRDGYARQTDLDDVSTSRRRRRRRSISVPSFDDRVNEGPAAESTSPGSTERTRFQKNNNSPVRWRLLADGVSGKIPLIDQRAILELAFRMWSEVIPLKFHETNSVDIVDMDVVIAFAKRESAIVAVIMQPFLPIGGHVRIAFCLSVYLSRICI